MTEIMVVLRCQLPERLGGVRANGKFNICAELVKMVVSPLQTSVGNDIQLSATGSDAEDDDISYRWEVAGGSVANDTASETTYTCEEVGEHTITVTVTDEPESCEDGWTVAITCVEGNGGTGGTGGAGGGAGGAGGGAGAGGCPAGANTPEMVDLKVTTGLVTSYEDTTAGLEVTPGPDSGLLAGNSAVGMGTTAIGPSLSIQDIGDSGALANESIVLQIFRTDGSMLGIAEGATNVLLRINGPSTSELMLTAEDKDGADLGSAMTTIGNKTIDVSALISSEIHQLIVEATNGATTVTGLDYTHLCLGYTP